MGNLLAYSGLTTKVKAMQSRLLTSSQFQEMASLDSVAACVEYLKSQPAYETVLGSTEPGELHRSVIEQYLKLSEYRDFDRLYRFSNLNQRKFLDFYFMHYEVALLKRCLRSIIGHSPLDFDLSLFQQFFDSRSSLDFSKIAEAKSLPQFTAALEGSVFYPLLSSLSREDSISLFDYENGLDMFYFKTMWQIMNKKIKASDRKILVQCFGSRMDMLNIQWIYRCKQFYHLAPADIYALLIPIQYRLKASDIHNLTESETIDGFFSVLNSTWYRRELENIPVKHPNPEVLARQVHEHIYQYTSQKEPYSVAILSAYFYRKDKEIQQLITIIESIRYGVPSQTILSSIANSN